MKSAFYRLGTLAAFALCVMVPAVAFAARFATVDDDEVIVHKGPGKKFDEVSRLKRGARIHASNYPTEGYYKVRTPAGKIGWVKADSLVLDPIPTGSSTHGSGAENGSSDSSSNPPADSPGSQ